MFNSSDQLTGPYILNFSYLDANGKLSGISNSAKVIFDPSTKTFTVNGKTHEYYYSWFGWGQYGEARPIIILDDRHGGYYAITQANIDLSKIIFKKETTLEEPKFSDAWTIWDPNGPGQERYLHFDSSGNTYFDPCFLAGTKISVCGEFQDIDDLVVGGQIDVFVKGQTSQQTISWIGKSVRKSSPHLPDDQAGYPVRVLKDAISDGVPFKDMLITAEHCLFFDGKFVPARMLVNGRSIFFDKTITSYDYYHIETENHSVIMADGMLTESYLDTGNRHSFSQSGNVISTGHSRNLTWDDAAAPLTVSRETVEPLFRQIATRAEKAGVAIHTPVRPLTNDSAIHLTTETGLVIRPTREHNGQVIFMIPGGIENVRLVSHASRPCNVIGPFVDDRRQLGVLVGEIKLFECDTTQTLTDHLYDPHLSGWNNVEEGTTRWTNGNARLSLGHRASDSIALMAIEVRAAGPYILDENFFEQHALTA
ncbi:Hint domain-containing protein [Asaia astilbis]